MFAYRPIDIDLQNKQKMVRIRFTLFDPLLLLFDGSLLNFPVVLASPFGELVKGWRTLNVVSESKSVSVQPRAERNIR